MQLLIQTHACPEMTNNSSQAVRSHESIILFLLLLILGGFFCFVLCPYQLNNHTKPYYHPPLLYKPPLLPPPILNCQCKVGGNPFQTNSIQLPSLFSQRSVICLIRTGRPVASDNRYDQECSTTPVLLLCSHGNAIF